MASYWKGPDWTRLRSFLDFACSPYVCEGFVHCAKTCMSIPCPMSSMGADVVNR